MHVPRLVRARPRAGLTKTQASDATGNVRGFLAREHTARCRVLGRVHSSAMNETCVLASLGARNPGSAQRHRPHHYSCGGTRSASSRGALGRGGDRVQERRADAGALELADRPGRRPAGRRHCFPELDRVHLLVPKEPRAAEHRLHDELRRDVAGEAEQQPRLDHRLGEEREVRRAGTGERSDRVHVFLCDAHDGPEMAERRGRHPRGPFVARESPPQIPAMPSCTSAGAFGIARTTRAPSGKPRLDHPRSSTPAATESSVWSGSTDVCVSVQQAGDVLRLDGEHDERRRGSRQRCRQSSSTP